MHLIIVDHILVFPKSLSLSLVADTKEAPQLDKKILSKFYITLKPDSEPCFSNPDPLKKIVIRPGHI